MTKTTITQLFLGSLGAIIAGILFILVTATAVLATGTWVINGSEVTDFRLSPTATSTFWFALIGGILVVAGAIGQFVAWIGALVNTARLTDKLWFVVLLVLGLFGVGFIAMLVYVIAGPDGTIESQQPDPGGMEPVRT
jgi:uncharacterized membrane protein